MNPQGGGNRRCLWAQESRCHAGELRIGELVKAGKIDEAKAAERRAQVWVDRMTALEAKMRKAR